MKGIGTAAMVALGAGMALSGLRPDRDGFVSEADREASLFLAGHNVHLSPAAHTIVEERLRREGGPIFIGYDLARTDSGKAILQEPRQFRKFKHNRRG